MHYLFIYLYIYFPLFNDAIDISKHKPSKGRIITGE